MPEPVVRSRKDCFLFSSLTHTKFHSPYVSSALILLLYLKVICTRHKIILFKNVQTQLRLINRTTMAIGFCCSMSEWLSYVDSSTPLNSSWPGNTVEPQWLGFGYFLNTFTVRILILELGYLGHKI